MKHEVNISLEDVRAVANGEEYDTWGEAYVWNGKIGAEYNLCFNGENCSAIYLMEKDDDGYWDTDTGIFEHYEIDPDDPKWKENLIKAMEKFVEDHEMEMNTISQTDVIETLRKFVTDNASDELHNEGAFLFASELTGLSIDALAEYVY